MDQDINEIKSYLQWRFRVNNVPKYQKYRDEWVNNIPPVQLTTVYKKEMLSMIRKGKYIV